MALLESRELSKKYAGNAHFALNNVSLSIHEGEIVALLGESGSGKTTLLRLIAGFEEANQGSLVVNGRTFIDQHNSLTPEKRNLGMVFQDYALFPHMTVEKNIAYGIKHKDKKGTVTDMLQLVGMIDFAKRFPHQLSGGQQQRVALARALATQPYVLLLDEPFSNLDEALKEQVRNDLKRILKKSNTTAIFVTHDTRDALAVADRIAMLKEGKLQQFDTPQQLFEHPDNEYVAQYFGKVNWLKSEKHSTELAALLATFPSLSKQRLSQQIGIRPSNIELFSEHQSQSITAKVIDCTYCGHYQEVSIKIAELELTANATLQQVWEIGQTVYVKFDMNKLISIQINN